MGRVSHQLGLSALALLAETSRERHVVIVTHGASETCVIWASLGRSDLHKRGVRGGITPTSQCVLAGVFAVEGRS